MNFIKRTLIVVLLNFAVFLKANSQSGNAKFCIDAEPLCGSSEFSYPNTSGFNLAEKGPDYGCLFLQLNPSWFYLQIAQDGDIELKIEQSTTLNGVADLDVDFVVFGPFSELQTPCFNQLIDAKRIDCSYNINFIEYANLPNTKAGEYYYLMITNFSRKPGYIKVTQTTGAATTNCNLLKPPIVSSKTSCEGDTIPLDANTNNATNFNWYEVDYQGDFKLINGQNSSALDVTKSNVYKAEAMNANAVVLEQYVFNVNFNEAPNIPVNISDYNICDTYGDNFDGKAVFNFELKNEEILNGLNPSNFSVTYYKSETDAVNGINPLPLQYQNTLETELIYVRVENTASTNPVCFDVSAFLIEVNPLPEINLEASYTLCINTNGTEEITSPPIIDTGLSKTTYQFEWKLNGTSLANETEAYIIPKAEGVYTVEVKHSTTNCINYAETNVILSEPPSLNAEVISNAFIEANNIKVTATAIGVQDFEYSIDGGVWQTNDVFENVSLGKHIITARNLSGCGETNTSIMVMDYPLYFTPNNDGYNDTWNIVGMQNQLQAKVCIFDRYGKLIKTLKPNSNGWDGTFKGALMPTDDYWFTVDYIEPTTQIPSVFKSHFTLKR